MTHSGLEKKKNTSIGPAAACGGHLWLRVWPKSLSKHSALPKILGFRFVFCAQEDGTILKPLRTKVVLCLSPMNVYVLTLALCNRLWALTRTGKKKSCVDTSLSFLEQNQKDHKFSPIGSVLLPTVVYLATISPYISFCARKCCT